MAILSPGLELSTLCSIVGFLVVFWLGMANGHGRVMEPPSRSSLWRLEEYKRSYPEKNYDDNQIWCGGVGVQYDQNGGKCGPCGDAWNEKKPRDNEDGGRYGRAIIARTYSPGQVINVAVELTANHLGHFEFNLCPLTTFPEEEECFQKYPLMLADGSGKKYMVTRNGTGYYNTTLLLPKDIKCKQCTLRWHYRTANRWNFITNSTGEVGAGDQEIFRSCSDITIGTFPPVVPRPPTHEVPPEEMMPEDVTEKPSSTTTSSTTTTTTTTTTPKPVTTTKVTTPKPPKQTTPAKLPSPPTTVGAKPPSRPAQKPPPVKPPTHKPSSSTTTLSPEPITSQTTKRPSGMPMQRPPKPEKPSSRPPHSHPTNKPPILTEELIPMTYG